MRCNSPAYTPNPTMHAMQVINSSYPEEIVRYYSPAYPQMLLQRLNVLAGSTPTPAPAGAPASGGVPMTAH